MLTFVLVQEKEDELHLFFSSIIQLTISNPNNNILCCCNESIFNVIKKRFPENKHLLHFKIDIIDERNVKYFLLNWINSLEYSVKNYENAVYVPNNIILVSEAPITQELKDQNIAFLKLRQAYSHANSIGDKDNAKKEKTNYSLTLFYLSSLHVIESIKKHFSKETNLFEEETPEIDVTNREQFLNFLEERKKYLKVWREIPSAFADMDDGTISVAKYIDCSGYVTTSDFFSFKSPFKIEDFNISDRSIYNKENKVWGINITTQVDEAVIRKTNADLTGLLIRYNRSYLPLINMKYSKSIMKITVPEKQQIAHWNRENDTFYNYIHDICSENSIIDLDEYKRDSHFYISNYVLFDKPDIKYVVPKIQSCFGILYFDYNNELLELFEKIDRKTTFMGYYSPYPNILESFTDPQDVKRLGTKTLKEAEYSNEEEFKLYLDDLATFKYFTVDKNTPKNRIAECLRLGVVPRLSDDTTLLEIEDIAKDKDSEWEILSEKCREYYSKNLSLNVMTTKLFKIVFNM